MSLKKYVYSVFKLYANSKVSKNKTISSRVFIYHNVEASQKELFRRQIELIKKHFDEVVDASEFVRLSQSNQLKSKKYACITFDDGFDDMYNYAKPVLDELYLTATIFLNQKLYDLTNLKSESLNDFVHEKFPRISGSNKTLKGLSKEQITAFIADGYEIGGHTYSHTSVPKLSNLQFEKEIKDQKKFIKKEFNYDISSFAYPYGRKNNIPDWGEDALKRADYSSGFSGISYNLNDLKTINPYKFPRTSVSLEITEEEFIKVVKGRSDILDKLTRQY